MDIAIPVIKISLGTSISIAILLLFTPIINKRYDPKWKCWIWLIIILRLSMPIDLQIIKAPISVNIPIIPSINQGFQSTNYVENNEVKNMIKQIDRKRKYTIVDIINIIWLIGAIVTFVYQIFMYHGFRRQVLRWSIPIRNSDTHNCYKSTYREMNIKCYIRVLVCDKVSSPMMIGFMQPMLILPHENYGDIDLRFIIRHELIHHKNHHVWFKLLILITSSIHWFNPLIYIARSEINNSIELCCDSEVIKNKSYDDRRAYGNAIIDSIAFNKNNSVLSTYFNQSTDVMKERLRSVLDMKIRNKGILAFVVVLLCVFALSEVIALTSDSSTDVPLVELTGTTIDTDIEGVDLGSEESYDIDSICNAVLSNNIKYITDFVKNTNSSKAILNTKNSEGMYPLEITLIMTNCDMAELLLSAGADPSLKTSEDKSIYDIALENSSKIYVDIFKSYIK